MNRKCFLSIIISLIILSLSLGVLAAEETEDIFSLKQAIIIALEQSPEITLAKFNIREAEFALKQAESRRGIDISEESLARAKQDYLDTIRNFEQTQLSLALDIKEKYYDLYQARQRVEFSQINLENVKQRDEINKKRLEAGLLTEMDMFLDGLDKIVDNAYLQLEQDKRNVETIEMNFNILIGRSLEEKIGELYIDTSYKIIEYDLAESVEIAKSQRQDLANALKNLAEAKQNLDLLSTEFSSPMQLEQAEMAVSRADFNLQRVKNNIILLVRQAFQSYQNALRNIHNKEDGLVRAKKNLEIAERRYQANLMSLSAIQTSRNSLIEAEKDLVKAICDFNLSKAGFLRTLGLDYGPLTRIIERQD